MNNNTFDTNIDRTRNLVCYGTDGEAAVSLVETGVEVEDAFFAVEAAKLLNKWAAETCA